MKWSCKLETNLLVSSCEKMTSRFFFSLWIRTIISSASSAVESLKPSDPVCVCVCSRVTFRHTEVGVVECLTGCVENHWVGLVFTSHHLALYVQKTEQKHSKAFSRWKASVNITNVTFPLSHISTSSTVRPAQTSLCSQDIFVHSCHGDENVPLVSGFSQTSSCYSYLFTDSGNTLRSAGNVYKPCACFFFKILMRSSSPPGWSISMSGV